MGEANGAQVRKPLSSVRYPRLPEASAALNAALQDWQLEHAANALDCRSGLGEKLGGDEEPYTLFAEFTFRGWRLVSLRERAEYSCGGAQPDGYDVGLILDRATGRPVPVTAIWPGLTPARLGALYLARGKPNAGRS